MLALPAQAGDVTYDYDGQGRLVAAVDNTINTGTNGVQYVYDAVGNITAINAPGATGGTEAFNEYPTLGRVGSILKSPIPTTTTTGSRRSAIIWEP